MMRLLRRILRLFIAPYRTEPKRPGVMWHYPQVDTEEGAWLKKARRK